MPDLSSDATLSYARPKREKYPLTQCYPGISRSDLIWPDRRGTLSENPRVGGSNPPLGTIFFKYLADLFMLHPKAETAT
jgi:hypothetical protein